MKSVKSLIFGKSVPFFSYLTETTREGLNKGYIPKFLYKPPFGYPRYSNIDYVRYLAKTPYVEMCVDTILKEISSVEWEIVVNENLPEQIKESMYDENGKLKPEYESELNHIKAFFENPNTNNETFEDVFVNMAYRDVLEINSGVINKVFNLKGEMVEIVARDGATFTKNPDIHGMLTNRQDLIIPKKIVQNMSEAVNPFQHIPARTAQNDAAYFQYGWIAGPLPIPFGRKEIIWLENMKRSDDIYGYSAVQLLAKSIQMLLYHIESDLEYFNDNNVPKGIIGLDASDSDEIKAFKNQWFDNQYAKDDFGNYKKKMHKIPIVNYVPKFERIQFSSQEIQLIEKQRWYSKMVWACFGVTGVELGYTEDAAGQANQIVQSKVFRKKAINPALRKITHSINKQIIPEFEYIVEIPIGKKTLPMNRYVFKYNMFDVDEETNKANLYEKWIDNGIKTVNEIRKLEGDSPVEWGDDKPIKFRSSGNNFNFNNPNGTEVDENIEKPTNSKRPDDNVEKTKEEMRNKSIESKPFGEYEDFNECVRDNQDKRDPEAYCAEIHKEITGEYPSEKTKKKSKNPLILGENEVPDKDKLKRGLLYLLKQNEKYIIDKVRKEMKEDIIKNIKSGDLSNLEVKSLNEIIKNINSLVNMNSIKSLLAKVIRHEFLKGAEDSEETINKKVNFNYVPDSDAIDYIQNYTFDNVKGMTEEIQNKLSQQLKIGFMNGEGVDKIIKRVKNSFDVSENRAETIARTESARAHQLGKLSAFKQSGVKAKKWLLWTNDHRTSEITKALHKKYGSIEKAIPLDKNFKCTVKVGKKTVVIDQQAGPFHPNERDELIIEVE